MSANRHHNALAPGYRLHWYRIESVLGQGGFGITYLATDTNLDQHVAIKEFLPTDLAVRTHDSGVHAVSDARQDTFGWGLTRFLSEARTLAQFRHPNIVRVYSVFEANGTAYMVMEYERGTSLEDALKFRRLEGERALVMLVHALMDGLELVHAAGFIHRDIKPDNVFLRAQDGVPVLLDFGSARQAVGVETRTLTSLVTPGYAPFEQYNATRDNDRQGPWTDIYSLAATLYRGITGRGPIDAVARADALLRGEPDPLLTLAAMEPAGVSAQLLAAVDHGLAFQPADRPQSLAQWRTELPARPTTPDFSAAVPTIAAGPGGRDRAEEDTVVRADVAQARGTTTPRVAPRPSPETPPRPRGARRALIAGVVLAVAAAGALAAWLALRAQDPPAASRPPAGTAGPGESTPPAALPAPPAVPVPGAAPGLAGERAKLAEDRKALEAERARLAMDAGRRSMEQAREAAAQEAERLEAARIRLEEERRKLQQARAEVPAGEPARAANEAPARPAGQSPAPPAGSPSVSGRVAVQAAPPAAVGSAPPAAPGVAASAPRDDTAVRVRALLADADAHLRALRLTSPADGNAVAAYREVLALDASNADARAGLEQVVTRYLALVDDALADGAPERAVTMLERARRVDADDSRLAGAAQRIEAARLDLLARAAQQAAREAAEREQAARRQRELERAGAAEAQRAREEAARLEARAAREREETLAREKAAADASRRASLGVFPNEFLRSCFYPVGRRIEDAARAEAAARGGVEFGYSYYAPGANLSPIGTGEAMWQGSAVHKAPAVERVQAAARALGVDAVLMGWYHCHDSQYFDEDTYTLELYLVDVRTGKVYSAKSPTTGTARVLQQLLATLYASRGM